MLRIIQDKLSAGGTAGIVNGHKRYGRIRNADSDDRREKEQGSWKKELIR
ncbi:MAG: hypothetical protein K5697_01655 [Lachnospiraceae bacterium]|nr:hypothetical protein [Lachnospiraceae bacterium]